MGLVAVEGIYEDGRVELAEHPAGIGRSRVIVTFIPGPVDNGGPDPENPETLRQAAAERMLERMRRGINFGGGKFDREELYEERMNTLEERRGRH